MLKVFAVQTQNQPINSSFVSNNNPNKSGGGHVDPDGRNRAGVLVFKEYDLGVPHAAINEKMPHALGDLRSAWVLRQHRYFDNGTTLEFHGRIISGLEAAANPFENLAEKSRVLKNPSAAKQTFERILGNFLAAGRAHDGFSFGQLFFRPFSFQLFGRVFFRSFPIMKVFIGHCASPH